MLLAVIQQQVDHQKHDEELLRRIQQRDALAFAEIYDRYARLLFAISQKILTSTGEAEDILQEVFLLVWEKAHTYSAERGTVYAWITALCRNKSIDRLRSRGHREREKQVDIDLYAGLKNEDAADDPHEALVWEGYRSLVARALKEMDNGQRQILELSYFCGHSQSEIAAKLGVPLGTVKTRMRSGLEKLRQFVRKESDIWK